VAHLLVDAVESPSGEQETKTKVTIANAAKRPMEPSSMPSLLPFRDPGQHQSARGANCGHGERRGSGDAVISRRRGCTLLGGFGKFVMRL
jgi:hypothetical protein